MTKAEELLSALKRFETTITMSAIGVTADLIDQAVALDPRIAYYLSSLSASINGMKVIFSLQYSNTNVPLDDIHIVHTDIEAYSLISRYVGSFKRHLVLFAKPFVNVNGMHRKFSETEAPFHPNLVSISSSQGSTSLTPMSFYYFDFDYRLGRVKLAMMENETNAEVARIAKMLFLPTMNEETKAFLAHNYLAHTIKYTLKEDANDVERGYMQSAYGALVKHKCVCQGYAEAYKRLMNYAGIQCDVVTGQTKGSDVYHAWNILRLNGGRDNYHVDVTWDSTDTKVLYTYFGLKDSDFLGQRTWNKELNAKCNSMKNLLIEGRRGIMKFKSQLLANGVSVQMLGY